MHLELQVPKDTKWILNFHALRQMFLKEVTFVSDDATTAYFWYHFEVNQDNPMDFIALIWFVVLLDEWHSQFFLWSGTTQLCYIGC